MAEDAEAVITPPVCPLFFFKMYDKAVGLMGSDDTVDGSLRMCSPELEPADIGTMVYCDVKNLN